MGHTNLLFFSSSFSFRCIRQSLEDSNRCPKCNYIVDNVDQLYPNFLGRSFLAAVVFCSSLSFCSVYLSFVRSFFFFFFFYQRKDLMFVHLDINIRHMRLIVHVITCFYLQTQNDFNQRLSQNTVLFAHETALWGKHKVYMCTTIMVKGCRY